VARPWVHTDDPTLDFNSDEVDAARAARCLIEVDVDFGERKGTVSFITDGAVAVDLAVRHVERIEKEVAEQRRQKEEQETKRAAEDTTRKAEAKAKKEEDDGPTPYEQRMARQAAARSWNLDLGHNIIAARGEVGSRKDLALNRAKALVLFYVSDNYNIASVGLRLVLSQLQEVEHKQLKTTGKSREGITYATPEEARKWLEQRVEMARTVNEVMEVWADAALAAILADEGELPQSKRVHKGLPSLGLAAQLLDEEVKAVRPQRRAKAKS
jgi:hypothetical protein